VPVRALIILAKRYVYALGCCVYIFSVGWLRGRNRALMAAICSHFGMETLIVELELPEMPIDELLRGDERVRLPEPVSKDGNVSPLEMVVIARLTAALAPKRCFEFGTFDGRTALTFAANCPADAEVLTLDLPAGLLDATSLPLEQADRAYVAKAAIGERLRGRPEAQRVVQLLGDSATFDFTHYHGAVDLVFVDGSHAYEYVLCDSRNALKMLRLEGGVILWHDYGGWPGVTRALNHLRATDPAFRGLRRVAGTSFAYLARP